MRSEKTRARYRKSRAKSGRTPADWGAVQRSAPLGDSPKGARGVPRTCVGVGGWPTCARDVPRMRAWRERAGGVCTSLRVRPPSISNLPSPQNREKSFTRRRKKRGASPLAERIRKTAALVFSKSADVGKLIEVTGLHTR